MNAKYTLLVNTSDGFEDCWNPFFKLYYQYWNAKDVPILLNTEWKTGYSYFNLPISCTQSNASNPERRLTWSECLKNALTMVETELVLYVQEDYFIEQAVDNELIMDMVELMLKDPKIKYIGLTHFGNCPPFGAWKQDKRLVEVQQTKYRISTQAGIWRKETLNSYLKPEENGWMFEIFGTQRAKRRKELFLTLNRAFYNASCPAILYTHTGIIKGKWHRLMPALFNKHRIDMDFNIRGIYKEKSYLFRKLETGMKLLKQPIQFYKGMRGKD